MKKNGIAMRPVAEEFSATECGWLRRPEFDTASAKVWELPDGRLFASPSNAPPPRVARLAYMPPLRL